MHNSQSRVCHLLFTFVSRRRFCSPQASGFAHFRLFLRSLMESRPPRFPKPEPNFAADLEFVSLRLLSFSLPLSLFLLNSMPSSSSRRPFPFFPGARTPPSNTQDPPYDPLEHECTPIPIFHPPHSLEKEVKEQAKQDEEDEQAGRASLERSLSTLKNPAWCAELRREIATPDHPDWNVMYYENLKRIQEMVQDVWEKKYSFRRIVSFPFHHFLRVNPDLQGVLYSRSTSR